MIVGLFDHQYFWKVSINVLVFLLGVSHQAQVASEPTIFGWFRPVLVFDQ